MKFFKNDSKKIDRVHQGHHLRMLLENGCEQENAED
jgi:hypothetical protein